MNKIVIYIFLACIFSNYTNVLNAQQKNETGGDKSMSLLEAVDFALKNNTDIKNAQIDILIAKKKIWETTAIGLPQIAGKISYQNIFKAPVMNFATPYLISSPVYSTTNIDEVNYYKYSMGYAAQPIELGVKESMTFDLTLSQILFSGEYLVGVQAAKTFKLISEQGVKKAENDIRELVSNTYQMVLMLEKNKSILDTTLINVTKVVKELTEVKKAGFVEDSDVDQLRLTESNMKSAISTIVRQIEVVKNLLKMQIGLSLEQKLILTDKLDELLLKADLSVQASIEFNSSNNIGYQILETQEKLINLNLKRYKAQCLPTVVAFYRHQELDKEPAFNFNPKNILGISVDIPIFASGMRHARQQQVKLELEKIKNSKENVSKALSVEYTQALATYNNAKEKYLNEKQNVDLAKRIATNTLKKYRNGMATSLDLAQTQTQSLQVQITLTQAMYELLSAKNKLDKVLMSGTK